jgi:hypothetical protein
MLVSDIIAKGRNLSDTPNTAVYTAAEALQDVQVSWKEIYAYLCENNDDYFVTSLYVPNTSLTADVYRQYTYAYTLPADFYRLRLLQYQQSGLVTQFFPAYKMTLDGFGNTQNTPGYRFSGKTLIIYDPYVYPLYCLWYYPAPLTLVLTDDLVYPYNMIPEIIAYQIAIEIRRKNKTELTAWEARKKELWTSMDRQCSRDDFKPEQVKNVFNAGVNPYW